MKKNLRDEMPEVTAFIDSMRKEFGAAEIDSIIRRGMRGEPVFYAREGGIEIGTRSGGKLVGWNADGVAYNVTGDGDDQKN